MAELKTDKILLPKDFQIDLQDGWTLDIDIQNTPTKYTLTHGKKSISFNTNVTMNLCSRNYGIRLVKGRRQMVIPPHILQSFVEYDEFLKWYDPNMKSQNVSTNQNKAQPDHVTAENYISTDTSSFYQL